MKFFAYLAALPVFFILSSANAEGQSDPTVVPDVDLQRYVGQWYEIAHSPNFFQRGCVRSTAQYAILTPTSISVKNICYKKNGSKDILGKAKVADPNVPAKLKVRFNFFARGDYWIVDLDPHYQWAVVSGPQKKSLFILSRQAPMNPHILKGILDRLKYRGFKVDDLVYDRY